ncbi:hypothetical protein JQ557_19230 [Bradyrhizobium sp. U87765 SZCCT0131]|uniref:hypothetical protein n=1 Tax=unclassified Bradyrhizobium TaxID=2631580 RepID=UPI001BA92780|nr:MULTISPECIES: hypothetical protein [unclassified Bradyrhizobium]MBR1220147.1 hypothetical protein [Bradyrhizobium sp. U87765 SZCCT0131]MBR1263397.1 hypothetical protein [Bradyrhizobium sp. U87765 SZCCT0134]MBR1306720.1 hypothetical protein [Bradyrhizobium sp. U87765 SZCCT0110]MBR1323219.1 hypothetical protein [Bradyrhizobium sp. U87765 SZCCT0109]MBR1345674.1 hypothetical protein [Bradyrhizobium sp. U87765 SZCCT0048]
MNHELAGKTRDIIRLWNAMRMHERGSDTTRLFALRDELRRAIAERDRMVLEKRLYDRAS